MSYACETCGGRYTHLAHHLRHHPECGVCEFDSDAAEDSEAQEEHTEVAHMHTFKVSMCKDEIAYDLINLRYEHGFSNKNIELLKSYAQKWHEIAVNAGQSTSATVAPPMNLFKGLETKKLEFAHARNVLVNYIEPRQVVIDGIHKVVSFDTATLIERKLQNDASTRQSLLAASDFFKTGELFQKQPTVLNDMMDGVAARFHPQLMKPATPEEIDDLRVPLIFNCDDIEVCVCMTPRRTHPHTLRSCALYRHHSHLSSCI